MNYKLVSSKTVIAKVFRDFRPTHDNWTDDAIEWLGEALEYIGVHNVLEKKHTTVPVENYRAEIPCDLVHLDVVVYLDKRLPMSNTRLSNPYAGSTVTTKNVGIASGLQSNDYQSNQIKEVKNVSTVHSTEYFFLNPGYIVTSFDTGEIDILYDAIPVDDQGFPKMPDNVYAIEAASWYIISKMLMSGYTHSVINFQYADQRWTSALRSAQNDIKMPSPERMESFKNAWVRMTPRFNIADDFWTNWQDQENLLR